MQHKTINIDFININVVFVYKKKAFLKYCKKNNLHGDMEYEAVTTIITKPGTGHFGLIIAVDDCNNPLEEKALIVHEISHSVTEIFLHFGFSCDELRSYLNQYLYLEIIKYYDEIKNKKATR